MGKHWGGISWAQKVTPVGSRGTCPHEQGVCPGPSGASHKSRRLDVRIRRARLQASPVLLVPPASMPTPTSPMHTRAAAPVAALPTSQHHAPPTPGAVLRQHRGTLSLGLTVAQPYAEPSPWSP